MHAHVLAAQPNICMCVSEVHCFVLHATSLRAEKFAVSSGTLPILDVQKSLMLKDISGFERTQWSEHTITLTEHRENVRRIRQCPTKTGREKL